MDRAHAARRQDQANQWRDMADRARQRAEDSASPADRDSWLRDAEDYDRRADEAERDAAETKDRAAEADSGAAALREGTGAETQPSEAEGTGTREEDEDRDRPPVKVEDVLGTWRQGDSDTPFVILPRDADFEAYKNRLEAHTGNRIWKGEFEPFDEGDIRRYNDARLTFTYTPTADEMNAKVPMWARKAVEGDLQWKIELDEAGTCGTPMFTGFWWPGEIRWREGKNGGAGEARVTGKGAPVRVNLSAANDFKIEPNPSAIVIVGLPNGPDPWEEPVVSLAKGQLFFVEVRAPPSLAEKMGGAVSVTIAGKSGGDSTKLRLSRMKIDNHGWVTYGREPFAIGDKIYEDALGGEIEPTPLSMSWIMQWASGTKGRRLDLSVENEETVEVKYEDIATSFTIYNTWVQQGLARFEVAREQLLTLNFSALLDSKRSRLQKEVAHRRLMMIKNLSAMLGNDKLHDFQKFRLAELYLGRIVDQERQSGPGTIGGIVNMTDKRILKPYNDMYLQMSAGVGLGRRLKGPISEYMSIGARHKLGWYDGVIWTSLYELYQVEAVLYRARDDKRAEAYREIPLALSYTAYDVVVNQTNWDRAYFFLYQKDHFGKKMTWAEFLAGEFVGGVLNKTTKSFAPSSKQKRLNSTKRRDLEKLDVPAKNPAKPPKTVPEPAQQRLRDLGGKNKKTKKPPARCAAPPGVDTFDVELGDSLKWAQNLSQRTEAAKEWYGSTYKVNEDLAPQRPPQQFGMCVPQTGDYIAGKHDGASFNEMRNLYLMTYNRIIDPKKLIAVKNPETGKITKQHRLNYGFHDDAAEAYLRMRGAETVIVTHKDSNPRNLTLEDIARLKDEKHDVMAFIRPRGKSEDLHAVAITGFKRNAKGEITEVEFFDSAYSVIGEVSACEFNLRMVAGRDPSGVNKLIISKFPEKMKPRIDPPRQMVPPKAQPTIEWPTSKQTEGKAATASAADKSRPSYLPGLKKTLFDVLDEEYPDRSTMPSFHFTDVNSLQKMIAEKRFRMAGGAQFTYEGGLGHYERGQVVIRIKEGHEQFIELSRSNEARGLIPHYWPQGQGVGKRNESIIPTEHLEWLNPYRPKGPDRWVSFDEGEK